jgi:DNA-binding beta-propeller fold protein YncE
VSLVKTIDLVPAAALLSHVAVSPDGATGVATRNGDGKVAVVKLGPDSIAEKATLDVAPRPYAVSITPDGKYAVVASLGDPKANGMFTVIDISGDQPKIVGTADIGHESLEGAMMSNDGKWVAGVAHGGSTRPKDAPQFKPNGMVVLYKLDDGKLTKTSEAPIGAWSQGASFSKDGKTVAVQNMIQKNIQVFKNDDGKLTDTGQKIEVGGGAAAIRSSTDR